ncbi:hypothetical protein B0O99DRAFT_202448 [Bisporella sp. PMI_857]|nr:hypothetical protein B0O99DRAFT_202448 [Bisporella sp. PMI_857]
MESKTEEVVPTQLTQTQVKARAAKGNGTAKKLEEKQLAESMSAMTITNNSSSPTNDAVVSSSTHITEPARTRLFNVKLSLGKGLGVFACRDIKKGEEIFREAPLFETSAQWLCIEANVAMLPEDKKRQFFALHGQCNCHKTPCEETAVMKIWDVNSFEIRGGSNVNDNSRVVRTYLTASRLNHACFANATYKFTRNNYIVFRATQDIKKSEEITHDYMGARYFTVSYRRRILQEKYGFECGCDGCVNNQGTELSDEQVMGKLVELTNEVNILEGDKNDAEVLGLYTKDELITFDFVRQWSDRILQTIDGYLTDKEVLRFALYATLHSPAQKVAESFIQKFVEMKIHKLLEINNKFGLSEDALDRCKAKTAEKIVVVMKQMGWANKGGLQEKIDDLVRQGIIIRAPGELRRCKEHYVYKLTSDIIGPKERYIFV